MGFRIQIVFVALLLAGCNEQPVMWSRWRIDKALEACKSSEIDFLWYAQYVYYVRCRDGSLVKLEQPN